MVSTLRSNGYDVVATTERYGGTTDDAALLTSARESGRVVLTNDRDFVRLDEAIDHAGIVLYTSQGHEPGTFVRAIRRVDRQFEPETIENTLVWLDQWV